MGMLSLSSNLYDNNAGFETAYYDVFSDWLVANGLKIDICLATSQLHSCTLSLEKDKEFGTVKVAESSAGMETAGGTDQ